MSPNLLILGGTLEATALCRLLATRGMTATLSLAGRVARPKPSPIPRRVGGFGGVAGLVTYLNDHRVTHVIDATHPFAAQMSQHAIAACARTGTPLVALTRPPWTPAPGDHWDRVPDIPDAVAALAGPRRRVMLALGRMHLAAFAPQPQHFYLLRLVDPPATPPPLPDTHILVDRGPFKCAADRALMVDHGIDLVVSKNAGGTASYAKIAAARELGLPVLMIDRPAIGARDTVATPEAVLDWVAHHATERGV